MWLYGILPTRQIKTHRAVPAKAYRYARLLDDGHVFPPVHVSRNKHGQWLCRDGAHRIMAHLLLDRNYIRVRYKHIPNAPPCAVCSRVGGPLVYCTVCGNPKAPCGRSAPAECTYCDYGCVGYNREPTPDTLWPGERYGDSLGHMDWHLLKKKSEVTT